MEWRARWMICRGWGEEGGPSKFQPKYSKKYSHFLVLPFPVHESLQDRSELLSRARMVV